MIDTQINLKQISGTIAHLMEKQYLCTNERQIPRARLAQPTFFDAKAEA